MRRIFYTLELSTLCQSFERCNSEVSINSGKRSFVIMIDFYQALSSVQGLDKWRCEIICLEKRLNIIYSMKFIFIILFISLLNFAYSQQNVAGLYSRMDSKIWLNKDSTFKYFYSVDTYRGWAKGKWESNGNKILLTPLPIYDTISVVIGLGMKKDSLILSRDYTPSRIDETQKVMYLFDFEQNFKLCPKVLMLKKRKLYVVENGKLLKNRIQNGYYIDDFDPWFIKSGSTDQ